MKLKIVCAPFFLHLYMNSFQRNALLLYINEDWTGNSHFKAYALHKAEMLGRTPTG